MYFKLKFTLGYLGRQALKMALSITGVPKKGTPKQPEQAEIWKNGKYNKWTTCKLTFLYSKANEDMEER